MSSNTDSGNFWMNQIGTGTHAPKSMQEEITKLRADLAKREAEIAKLRRVAQTVIDKESLGHPMVQEDWEPEYWELYETLSTQPSTSYLEQWVAENFELRLYITPEGETTNHPVVTEADTPLYARKEK